MLAPANDSFRRSRLLFVSDDGVSLSEAAMTGIGSFRLTKTSAADSSMVEALLDIGYQIPWSVEKSLSSLGNESYCTEFG